QVIISQRDTFDGGSFGRWPVQRRHVEVGLTSIDVELSFHDSTRRVSSRYTTAERPGDDSVRIMDGEVHHILRAATTTHPWEQVPPPGERARLWIDGREVLLLTELAEEDASSPVLVGPEFCRIGTGTGLAYQGIIDHL